jgi:hypothetical protein
MAFQRDKVSQLLAQCHRRCCICHRFCGVKNETDHILPIEQGGSDEIENAIPVCFECHAEIHGYNDQHPRGRKFTSTELQKHKKQWLQICSRNPSALISPTESRDVGPLQALIDELAFNLKLAKSLGIEELGAMFHDQQFRRAIEQGSIAILLDEIKECVLDAYAAMTAANGCIEAARGLGKSSSDEAKRRIQKAFPKIEAASNALLKVLASESSTCG